MNPRILLLHPWLRGTERDVLYIMERMKQQRPIGVITWLETGWEKAKEFFGDAWDTVKSVFVSEEVTPEEANQVVQSTASVVREYTADVRSRANELRYRYSQPGTWMTMGETGDHVRTLQELINELGIATISIDAIYGSQTRDAVTKLQKMLGVDVDGYFGYYTAQAFMDYITKLTDDAAWYQKVSAAVAKPVVTSIKVPTLQPQLPEMVKKEVSQTPIQPTVAFMEQKVLGLPMPLVLGGSLILLVFMMRGRRE